MNITQVYVGGWFQRTTLHLSEIYDFCREGYSSLNLEKEKLLSFQKSLNIKTVDLTIDNLEYILVTTHDGISIKISEDGLIVLHNEYSKENGDVALAIQLLTDYYEKKLGPALSYLFSLGAPIPKELANIKTVYPYFVIAEKASREEILTLLNDFGQKKYFEASHESFDLFRGDKFYIINFKKESSAHVSRFVEEQIFLREFKGQLHRYLNLHRIIWERIAEVKEKGSIQGGSLDKFRTKVEGYAKTINLVGARINQMNTYLETREEIAKNDPSLKKFLTVIEFRYDALAATLKYIQEIWSMTKNYVNAALDLFSSVQNKATQNSIKNLTVITILGVGATLLKLLTEESIPSFTGFGMLYLLGLVVIGFGADAVMKWLYKRKSYAISDVEYDADIR